MNCYASIADLKTALSVTSTTDDTVMRKIIDAASRMIDSYCGRKFYIENTTKYYDGALRLWVDDLLSIDTSGLKTDEDGDATYENTLATTDYLLYPLNKYPKTYIEISNDSDYGSFGGGVKNSVKITGLWGYGDGISATPYIADTTIAEDLTAGEADITVTAATNLSAGQTILIGSEQYFIYSISSTALTTEPGVNGTTEATHSSGATINIYQYPLDIWQTCLKLAAAVYDTRQEQGIKSKTLGDYSYVMADRMLDNDIISVLQSYRIIRV